MKFESIGGTLTNLEHVETIACYNNTATSKGKKKKSANDIPFEIHFELTSGKVLRERYKNELKRDRQFQTLAASLMELK